MIKKLAPTSQNTINEVRAEANIILKVVDQCIKAGLLDDAKEHLEKARLIDPTNAYIYAFEERILFLKQEASKRDVAASTRVAMEDEVRAKLEAERKKAEEERQRKEAENAKKLEASRQKRVEIEANKIISTESKNIIGSPQTVPNVQGVIADQKRFIPSSPSNTPQTKPNIQTQRTVANASAQNATSVKSPSQAHDMYKRVLLLAWADGAISPEEQIQLQDLRATLRISEEEHNKLELEAKEESYSHALKIVINSGIGVKERSVVISELQQKYQISPEMHAKIEEKLQGTTISPQSKQLLYVIDDDENILNILKRILESSGYTVKSFFTSDEALVSLQKDSPDLIISDINLETSTIGGFSFYEKVRQLDHLLHVPFIFLSGLTDEGMIRYGKSLGVDDYITKPFTSEMLLDTIKGKIKRYKQLKQN